MSRRSIHKSEAQSNAEALRRRGLPYSAASEVSFSIKWDHHRREPADLREAVHMVRKAYADEIPVKLHDGPDAIGDDGTPRMSARAEGYIFGRDDADDSPSAKCAPDCRFHRDNVFGDLSDGGRNHEPHCPAHPSNRPLVSYYLAPFKATLSEMERGDEACRKRAAIVGHVTIGSQGAQEAAVAEGVPHWCAKTVAEDALRAFLHRLSDMKLSIPKEAVAS